MPRGADRFASDPLVRNRAIVRNEPNAPGLFVASKQLKSTPARSNLRNRSKKRATADLSSKRRVDFNRIEKEKIARPKIGGENARNNREGFERCDG